MNKTLALLPLAVLIGCAAMAIDDKDLGLRKHSVFDVITPTAFDFEGADKRPLEPPLPGSGMPPMIGHEVNEHLPITAKNNDCLDCHDRPQAIGQPRPSGGSGKGKGTPAPISHYVMAGGKPALSGANYNCMSCHAPQAGVAPLVRNLSH